MDYFLERIAKSLRSEFGDNLNSHCLVFPGRRAGLFFTKYLSKEITRPVWTPGVKTINDLFHSLSDYQQAENELLLFELYKVYRTIKKTQETFEDFFYWGDMLLNDFDDVDKYLADPSVLFRNVSDLKKIDQQFGALSPEQADIVKRFWTNFDPEKITEQKSGFISIWSVLEEIYHAYKASLKKRNIAYEGMIFRDVVEKESWKDHNLLKWKMIHFIGFNALNECERTLMLNLKKEGQARFYWDYDNSYISGTNLNSAGFFLKKNLKDFGNDMPQDWNTSTFLSGDQKNVRRRVIDTSSDVAQVKLIPGLIDDLPDLRPENMHETAVILSDENLLLPVLSSLPENVRDINLTMGFPLRQTPVYTTIENILELHRNARSKNDDVLFSGGDSIKILKDPFISQVLDIEGQELIPGIENSGSAWIPSAFFSGSPAISGLFVRASGPQAISGIVKLALTLILSSPGEPETEDNKNFFSRKNIRNEFIYRIMLAVNRLDDAIIKSDINISAGSWMRILERLLRMQSVPFSGEPLSGLQIMGILETRALDFKNLIILSVNEGILPSSTSSSSFIPFSLRNAFGLPSINHQESVFAYHFYRLLHRAENVTFIYNSNPDGLRTGEMSRFLQQMKYDVSLKPGFISSGFRIKNPDTLGTSVARTDEHSGMLIQRTTREEGMPYMSSTAINTWLFCRMKFFYRYVNGLEEPAGSIEEIDPAMLGTLLHDILKKIYEPLIGMLINDRLIDGILQDRKELNMLIDHSLDDNFRNSGIPYAAGNELIVRDVLITYIERILRTDKAYSPFKVIDVEKPFRFEIDKIPGGEGIKIIAGGRIDRIDVREGNTRIVDYKTGKVEESIGSVSELFVDDRDKSLDGWLQVLFYCEGYLHSNPGIRIVPAIYKIQKAAGTLPDVRLQIKQNRSGTEPVGNYESVRDEFLHGLISVIKTVFSKDEPFIMTGKRWNKCGYCPYRELCLR